MKKLIVTSLLILLVFTINAQVNRTDVLQDLEKNKPVSQTTAQTATLKSASRLFGEKDDLTTVIMVIPSGSVVNVLGADSTYLHVTFEDYEGYIFRRHAVVKEIPAAVQAPVETSETTQVIRSQPRNQVSRFTYLEEKYGSSLAARLASGKIWKGMTAEMVSDSWGTPQKINRVISGNTIKEEWIFKNTWLYIEDDILVQWGPLKR
ncbi:MAG: hypothetical protein IQL11_13100 [Bacteroidales bacterium]|nr:hypothetical protein [Bacteroidales bacterium]